MAARGKAVRSAVSSGRHAITKGMRKTRSIGQDIERWWKVNEVQIPGTQDALYRAFLDSLIHDDNRGTFYRLTKCIETMDHNITVNRTFNRISLQLIPLVHKT